MVFEIEKNIPIPPIHEPVKRTEPAYPLAGMVVGDSFFVPVPNNGYRMDYQVARVQSEVHSQKKAYPGMNFATRRIKEGSKILGVRIWRIQ